MENKNYVEMFTEAANKLKVLLSKYGDKLPEERRNYIKVLIENTLLISDGRFEALDYDVRQEGIMHYSQQLDAAIEELEKFDIDDMDK